MIRLIAILLLTLAACGRADLPQPQTGVPVAARFADADPVDFGPRGPSAYPVHGIDLSRWQPLIDWQAARAAGVNFAFIKATEGGDRIDPAFADHWQGAVGAGILPGAYHFFYFCTPAEVQARWFIANVPRVKGAAPPILDLEWNPLSPTCRRRPPPQTVRTEARRFADIVANHYGQRPILYVTPDFWAENDIGRLGEEVWLRATARLPSEEYPGTRWSFWQYSATGRVPGINGPVDLNVFAGSAADWTAWKARRLQR